MSRTEFKILKEDSFWAAVYKGPGIHSDQIRLERAASGLGPFLPAHRLDGETQGLLLLAAEKHWLSFHQLFKEASPELSKTEKIYLAGAPLITPPSLYSGYVGSRYRSSKKTRYSPIRDDLRGYHSIQEAHLEILDEKAPAASPLPGETHLVRLITGRRHQIRSFFASLNNPLEGDLLYGSKNSHVSLALFSWKLRFVDPISKGKVELEAPLNLFQT